MATNNSWGTWFTATGAFPWLSLEKTNEIKDRAKQMSDNSYDQKLIQDDLYKHELDKKTHQDFMAERQNGRMELYQKSKSTNSEVEKNKSQSQERMAALADMIREYGYNHGKNWDKMGDEELISRFTTKNPSIKKYSDDFLTGWPDSEYKLSQELWLTKDTARTKLEEKETFLEKSTDVAVWALNSPWKWGYNIIWQWMDRLGKRWAEQLEGSALEKWVQDKAVEMFWEDEVKAYREQKQKELEEWTAFNGREQTDIRTPILWEERANNKYTKAWEVVGDIASWIALTAPIWAAFAPAIAWWTLTDAALLWGIEWGLDTLLTQYGGQWNLDITPTQAILGIGGWALWGMFSNRLANMPKKQIQDIKKEAESYIDKSIRPTVKGKQNQAAYDKFIDDTLDITDFMSKNKDVLQYTDDAGELVTWKMPTNLNETRDSLANLKKFFYDNYNDIAQKAGDAWARVNLNKVFNQLDDLADDAATNIANPWLKKVIEWYKDSLLQYTDDLGTISIEDAQKLTQNYNKILDAFFKNPWAYANDTSRNIIIAQMNKWVKDAIDESMDDVLNAGINNGSSASETYKYRKQLYGKVKTMEDEVSKSALREMRKNTKGLSTDIVDALAWGEFTKSLLTMDLWGSVKWAVMKGINSYNKYLNSPNTQLNNLFKLVDSVNNGTNISTTATIAQNLSKPNVIASTTTALSNKNKE